MRIHRLGAAAAVLACLGGATARAESPPIVAFGIRAATGLRVDGTTPGSFALLPVNLALTAERALRTDPWVMVHGGLFAEPNFSVDVGVFAGLRLYFGDGGARLSGGVVSYLLPEIRSGVTASGGPCFDAGALHLCGDVEVALFFYGQGLPASGTSAQVKLAIELAFRAL